MQDIIGKEIIPSDSNPKIVLNEKSPAVIDVTLNSEEKGDEKGEGWKKNKKQKQKQTRKNFTFQQ